MNKLYQWLRKNYAKIVSSIAFFPAVIAIGFLVLSIVMLEIDFSEAGKLLKSRLSWLSLRDASTARAILTTIAGGIISLSVFSFSMVMILLNQAASQMSNRMLDSLISNRFQQVILGFYIGTITYALFLLSTIRDIASGVYVPALSIYLLLLFTVVDIFLFIYFLHFVTQSVKFDTIIHHIHQQTLHSLRRSSTCEKPQAFLLEASSGQTVHMPVSDYFQGCNLDALTRFARKHQVTIQFLHSSGSYLLKGSPLLLVVGKRLPPAAVEELLLFIDLHRGQPIDKNPSYGFHQLAEVAIKALSPGINDPQTAVLSIHALADLFRFQLDRYPVLQVFDQDHRLRLVKKEWEFGALFEQCMQPIWHYGHNDYYVREALRQMITQLQQCDSGKEHAPLLQSFQQRLNVDAPRAGD